MRTWRGTASRPTARYLRRGRRRKIRKKRGCATCSKTWPPTDAVRGHAMTIGFVFWLIMLIWLIFWAFGNFTPQGQPYWNRGGWLGGFVLFFLIGWRLFGFIIQN